MNNNPQILRFELTEAQGIDASDCILYPNFSGEEKKNNPKGVRNFCLVIPEDVGRDLAAKGWNVKFKETRTYLPIALRYDIPKYAPQVYQVRDLGGGQQKKIVWRENKIGELDAVQLKNVYLEVNPRVWGDDGAIKAYLKTMYFEIVEDSFASYFNFVDDDSNSGDDGELPFYGI